jgi:inorganic triphosphatase YgiF
MSEVEAALLFSSSNMKVILEKIQHLIRNRSYVAVKRGTKEIHDLYYDTSDRKLGSQKIQLRVRMLHEIDYKVTLKVVKTIRKNYSDRIEIERNWSKQSFHDILNNLYKMNIKFHGAWGFYNNDPKVTFSNLGLLIIQNRKTKREILSALNKISGQTELEFDFDTTSILIGGNHEFRFSELEIESKKSANEKNLEKIVIEILKFPEFMSWPYSKLETGIAITNLFNNKLLEPRHDYDEKNELTAIGVKKISHLLKSGDPYMN